MLFLKHSSLVRFPHSFQLSTIHRFLANFLLQNPHFTMLYGWLNDQPIRAFLEASKATTLFLALPCLSLLTQWL